MNKHHIIPPVRPEDQERALDELRDLLEEAIHFRAQSDLAVKEILTAIQVFRREHKL